MAFLTCTSLGCIKVPSTVERIGVAAFGDCMQLMNVELCKELEQIGDGAFGGCTSLGCIKLPSNVKMIGEYA